mmetsp:Transcript_58141/g.180631  ORF Transcript_58141/g.180631 Transcript_58141/m.180631 type:complete len:97 (+) Transcript_58141:617-907(+)
MPRSSKRPLTPPATGPPPTTAGRRPPTTAAGPRAWNTCGRRDEGTKEAGAVADAPPVQDKPKDVAAEVEEAEENIEMPEGSGAEEVVQPPPAPLSG